ncbi:ABC-2 type transporter [Evansella cellulosilytica DSM 2522]|uniref:ABC-2 type transporter n=2 Tax=Evansella TaxID=2837485 RepID=E6TZC1_EVAC2|nr:ABC-2 type transporter [Evansella cellulosilytica DSM 2522]
MNNFLIKDILVIVRERSELFILLLMPFILIGILGFALRGVLGGEITALQMTVAIVQEDVEQDGMKQFAEEISERQLPVEITNELQAIADEVSPIQLVNSVLEEETLKEMIAVEEMQAEEAEAALINGDVIATLTVPENFTYDTLRKMIFEEGEGSELKITVNEFGSLRASIFEDIITGVARSLNLETAIAQASGEPVPFLIENRELGGIETINAKEPVTSFQYYTIAMAVMFVLYVASTISSKAYVEKQQHVFNRILLSGTAPIAYLGSKSISASVLAFIQLSILFSLSTLLFQPFELDLQFWLGMVVITAMLALCIGAIAAFLTALTIKFNSESVSSFFSGGAVSILAFVGGSFIPTSEISPLLSSIGSWTPNGAALNVYLTWMQGFEWAALLSPLVLLAVQSIVFFLVSIIIFPKRRAVS